MSEIFSNFGQIINNSYLMMRLRYLFLLIVISILPVHGQDTAGSNIVSKTFLSVDETKAIEQRVYDNGLGDIVQEVQSYPGSSIPSVVVHHEYDEHRRKTKTWLPITSSGDGFISGRSITALAKSQYSDDSPFSRTVYDDFLPSQAAAQYKAGSQWQDNDKKTALSYSEYLGVGMYVSGDGLIYTYPDVKYLCNRSIDEDGCPHAEYTDLNGRLLISESSQGQTYYIYNENGDICYVFPPALSEYITTNHGDDELKETDNMIQKYGYVYHYDYQRHCIYKKFPGCEPIYYIYDRTGSCILKQDGEQRQRGEWTYSIPDKFGRPCISGICKNTFSYADEPLHPYYIYAEYDGVSVATGGYAVYGLSLVSQTLHTAAYYDGYSFIGQHGVPSSLTASTVSGFSIDSSLGDGLQTGSATAILDGNIVRGYTYSAMYYDSRYNVSQVKSTNHLGGVDITCTEYSYTGKPLKVKVQHPIDGKYILTENIIYTYDDADRVKSCTTSVARGVPPQSVTLTYEYDDLGRLSKINRPFVSNNNPTVEYKYDLHGWMKEITTNSFREELFYADGPGSPCYNGNISSMRWWNEDYYWDRGYKFSYDHSNRLTQAVYGEGSTITSLNKFGESVQYDANANISRIIRNGKISSSSYGQMDNLTLSYDGYQLTGVTEAATDYDVAGSFEYKKTNGSQYLYNANGSLVADKSRGIAYIAYDVNNNPSRIYFTNGNVTTYVYSATGEKLSVKYYVAMPNITRPFGIKPEPSSQNNVVAVTQNDYILGGKLIIRENKIDRILFNGGYFKADAINSTTYGFLPFYYNQDHLGNNREVVNTSGHVQQLTNYYPFGAPYSDKLAVINASFQSYKYNGKELDLMHGLNTYDYGARQYDPILLKWDRVDPLCEKYYSVSPYAYCKNSPVKNIDPDGKKSYLIIWASDSHHYGHAAFAVDNYKYDSKNRVMVPDGTVTCYSLFPINSYTKKQAIKDEKVRGLFLVSQNVTLEAIKNNNFDSGENYKPDGILEINSDYYHDSETKQHMQDEMRSNKGYQGRSRNCSTFAREGVKQATGEDVKGEESSFLFFKYVTPNRLFQETSTLKDTKTIVDPDGKEKNSFVNY